MMAPSLSPQPQRLFRITFLLHYCTTIWEPGSDYFSQDRATGKDIVFFYS